MGISSEEIFKTVYEKTGLTVDVLRGEGRTRPIHNGRIMFVEMALKMGFSQMQIARFLNKDHSSIYQIMNKRGLR